MSFKRFANWCVYVVIRLSMCVVQSLSLETCQSLSRGLAWLAADVLKIRHSVVDDNIAHAFPEWSEHQRRRTIRRMWEHLVLFVCEIALAPRKIHETNWRDHVKLVGMDRQIAAQLSPRAAVMLTAHYGNFELAGFLSGLYGFPTFTVARPLDNPYVDKFVDDIRSIKGQKMLPKDGIAGLVANLLERGQSLAIVGDQFGGHKGCWLDFFGRQASYHKAIAMFSLSSGAPAVILFARRLGKPLQFELRTVKVLDPTIDTPETRGAREMIQAYNDALEYIIRLSPEQYWWLHRRWKDPRKKRLKIKNAGQEKNSPQAVSSGKISDKIAG